MKWYYSYDNGKAWNEVTDKDLIQALDTTIVLRNKFVNSQSVTRQEKYEIIFSYRQAVL